MMPETWNLRRRITVSGGEISYEVLGYGPSLILVHGTPSRSYIWRTISSGSDLLVLPETGHFAMEDSPQHVTAALFDFFTRCYTRPR
jgi:pimeloyl-ACP methyl ester carboxylesterase